VRHQRRAGAAAGSECGVTAVDPASGRLVTLKLPNPDGSGDIIDIRSLRSPEWLAETGAEPGGWILFGLPELGVVGPAHGVTVAPCPPVEAGPGRVVLATVTHYNSFVLRLWVAAGRALACGVVITGVTCRRRRNASESGALPATTAPSVRRDRAMGRGWPPRSRARCVYPSPGRARR